MRTVPKLIPDRPDIGGWLFSDGCGIGLPPVKHQANRTNSRYQVFRGGANALADLEAKDMAKKAAIIEEATRAQRAEEQRKKERLERLTAEREKYVNDKITQKILQAGMLM